MTGSTAADGAVSADAGREIFRLYEHRDAAVRGAAAPHRERLHRTVGG